MAGVIGAAVGLAVAAPVIAGGQVPSSDTINWVVLTVSAGVAATTWGLAWHSSERGEKSSKKRKPRVASRKKRLEASPRLEAAKRLKRQYDRRTARLEEMSANERPALLTRDTAIRLLLAAALAGVVWCTWYSLRNLLRSSSAAGHLGPENAGDILQALTGTAVLITACGLATARVLRAVGARRRSGGEGEAAVILAQAELRRAEAEYLRAKKGLPALPPVHYSDPSTNGGASASEVARGPQAL